MKLILHQRIPYILLYGILFLLWGGSLSSCTKSDPTKEDINPDVPDVNPETAITFNEGTDMNPTFGSEGGVLTVSFMASDNWTATIGNSRADSWLKLSQEQGNAGKASISISIEANDTYDERSASIFFTCGNIKETMVVTQKQNDALSVTQSRFEVPSEGGQILVEVKSNISITVEIASDWIHQIEDRGLETHQFTFRIDENTSAEGRTGKVLINGSDAQEEISVYQLAKDKQEEDVLLLSQKQVNVAANGETVKVELDYNQEFDYYPIADYSWVNEITSRAVSTHTFYFEVQPNETYESREAQYVFKSKTQELSDTLTIRQVQKNGLLVSEDQFLLNASEQELTITVESNIDYEVICDVDWIEQISTRSLESSILTFQIKENPNTEVRKGEILFQGNGLTQSVQIVQQGIQEKPVLLVSPSNIEIGAEASVFDVNIQTNVEYVVQINDSWIKETKSQILSEENVSFSADANTSTSPRTGTIIIQSEDRSLSQTVYVVQAGKEEEPYLAINTTKFELNATEQEINLEISTNEDYTIQVSDDWIIRKTLRSGEKDIISFTILENTSPETRNGSIQIKGKTLSKSVLIVQQGKPEGPQITVSAHEISIKSEASTFDLQIQANVTYSITVDVPWIKKTESRTLSEENVSFSVDANTSTSPRTGTITIQSEDETLKQTVTVSQAGKGTSEIEGDIEDFIEKEENW